MTLPLATIGIILILLSAMFLFDIKRTGLKEVGDNSLSLIDAYNDVEAELFYLDSSVRISAEKASKNYNEEYDFKNQFTNEFYKLLKLNNMPTNYEISIINGKIIGKTKDRIYWTDGIISYQEKEGKITYSKNLDFSYDFVLFDFKEFNKSYRRDCLISVKENLKDDEEKKELEACFDKSYDFKVLNKEKTKVIVEINYENQVIKAEIDLNNLK